MIRTIIIDDEPKVRKMISDILNTRCPDIKVVAQADSVKSGIDVINKYNPDLVLLDINLTDGNGFDLLEQIDKIDFKVIFITAYNQYAVRAIRISALDYILKPIDPEEIVRAVEKANEEINKDYLHIRLKTILSNFKMEEKKIVLKSAASHHIKSINEIIRCEASGNYTRFYFTKGDILIISKSLHEFEELLSEYGFYRVHSAHLVNMNFIDRCEKTKKGNLILRDETVIPVARSKKQDLLNQLAKMSLYK